VEPVANLIATASGIAAAIGLLSPAIKCGCSTGRPAKTDASYSTEFAVS
jgi:hypothetical protein